MMPDQLNNDVFEVPKILYKKDSERKVWISCKEFLRVLFVSGDLTRISCVRILSYYRLCFFSTEYSFLVPKLPQVHNSRYHNKQRKPRKNTRNHEKTRKRLFLIETDKNGAGPAQKCHFRGTKHFFRYQKSDIKN